MAQNLAFNNDNESERTKRTNESERKRTTTNEANDDNKRSEQTNKRRQRTTDDVTSFGWAEPLGAGRWALGAGRWALAGWLAAVVSLSVPQSAAVAALSQ